MHNLLKNGSNLIKNKLLKLNFEDEDHLDVNFLIYILTIYREWLLFQFFSHGISMHIAILTDVQIGRKGREKNSHILLENVFSFWSLLSEMKVTSIPFAIACFIFELVNVNIFFSGSYAVAYVCTFTS